MRTLLKAIFAGLLLVAVAQPSIAQTTYYLKISSSGLNTTNNSWSIPAGQNYINLTITSVAPASGSLMLGYGDPGYTSSWSSNDTACPVAGTQDIYIYGVPPSMKVIAASTGNVVGTVAIVPPATSSATLKVDAPTGRAARDGMGVRLADNTRITNFAYHGGCGGSSSGQWMLAFAGGSAPSPSYWGSSACGSGQVVSGVRSRTLLFPIYSSGCSGSVQGQFNMYEDYLIGY